MQYDLSVRGKWLLAGSAVILVALGAGAISWLRHRPAAATLRDEGAAPAQGFTGPNVSLPGRIEALEVVAVPVPFDGRIESFAADVGQDVNEGQLLAEIRNTGLESGRDNSLEELTRLRARVSSMESARIAARLEASRAKESAGAARSQMDAAQKELQRQQLLYGKGAAARQSLDKAQLAFEGASEFYDGLAKVSAMADNRAMELSKELDALEENLRQKIRDHEDTTVQVASGVVKSPVDGYIAARRGQPGEEVTMDTPDLFQIAVNVAQLRVVLEPPPPVLEKIHAGQQAMIQLAEVPDPIESKVTDVSGGKVTIEFASPNPAVKPGMTTQVVIKLN